LEGHVIESNIVANLNTIGLIDIPGIPQKVGPFDVFDAHIQVSLHVIDLAAIGHFFAARKGILATQMEKQKTENEVAAAVALLYVSFQRAGSQVKEVDANVRLFQKLLKISQDQFKVGLATQLDVHRMELQWANQQQALLLAQEQKEKVKLAFLHAIGADLGAELILTDPLRHEARTLPSLEEALSFALLQRPEVSQWKEAILAMDHQLRAEKASRFPSLDVRFWGGFSGVSLDELQGNRILMAETPNRGRCVVVGLVTVSEFPIYAV
jgi:multidrug efflux system outer membrane protein